MHFSHSAARIIRAMLKVVRNFLSRNPGLKAKTIASRLGLDRRVVNRLLHEHRDTFQQDSESCWSLASQNVLLVEFRGQTWLAARHLERRLVAVGSPLDSTSSQVVFALKDNCHVMLEALARLLALSNQLSQAGKSVTLDFNDAQGTLSYLDRLGFFDHLNRKVAVLPKRPKGQLSKKFQGNNDGLIELRAIKLAEEDRQITELLENSFVKIAGADYRVPVMTILTELYRNVLEHSRAESPGFAALQYYPKSRRIQAVISDNGQGIVRTLTPALSRSRYADIAKRIASSNEHPGVALLKEVFRTGGISQVDEEGRGLGLKVSGEHAKKFRATISIRQSDFELRIHHTDGDVKFTHLTELARIEGTHICFDFDLDSTNIAR